MNGKVLCLSILSKVDPFSVTGVVEGIGLSFQLGQLFSRLVR